MKYDVGIGQIIHKRTLVRQTFLVKMDSPIWDLSSIMSQTQAGIDVSNMQEFYRNWQIMAQLVDLPTNTFQALINTRLNLE